MLSSSKVALQIQRRTRTGHHSFDLDRELQGAKAAYYKNTGWEAEDDAPRTRDVDPDKEKERLLELDKLVKDINEPREARVQIKLVSVVTFFLCFVIVLRAVLRDVV